MNPSIEKLGNEINRIRSTATERSFYPLLCDFIRDFETETFKKRKELNPIIEEARRESQIGFPDITVRHGSALIGWIEIKLPKDSLANEKFSEQFSKYRNSLENVLFTNLREWELWQWDEKGQSRKVAECLFDPAHFALKEERHLENIIIRFLEGKAYPAKTPKQLAFALARKTRLLSQQVEEAFDEKDKESELYRLREAFQTTLIQNISVHQFSNMVAETLAYSLFLAFLEHAHREEKTELTLTSAIDYLPTNVPILADLYSLVSKVSQKIHVIQSAVTVLIEQLKEADIARIYQKLVDHKPGEDPVVQFYEPFLKEYDPKEREARGVYYTPKPVVDFIVRGVDYLLRTKFNKEDGLGDKTVQILDPATGTGTFLMSAIQQIHEDAKQKYAKLGEPMLRKAFDDIVLNHILKHFFGFELLVAPYAIAHLKLTLLLEKLGFDFDSTKGDNDPDNDRLKIYLANALDDPDKPPMTLFGFESIPEESEKARKVKKEAPIIVVMGNPPYSGQSANVSYKLEGKKKVPNFIGKLIRDYYFVDGKPLKERNPKWLQDDYVKFIRFAQWKIEQTGSGVLAFITNHGYLDNPTFRGMRQKLMNAFSEIYILDLHGNIKKGEKCPDGSKDEPVFQIQQGTCIGFFIKNKKAENTAATIKHSDLWGLRRAKFSVLLEKSLEGYSWNKGSLNNKLYNFYFFVF